MKQTDSCHEHRPNEDGWKAVHLLSGQFKFKFFNADGKTMESLGMEGICKFHNSVGAR